MRHNRKKDNSQHHNLVCNFLVVDEERHIDWIEAQQHQIKEVGYENYLAQQTV